MLGFREPESEEKTMKRIVSPLITAIFMISSFAVLFVGQAPNAYASPDGALSQRFKTEGHYGMVANGVGLNGMNDNDPAADRTFNLNVPGSVIKAYLYWSGHANVPPYDDSDFDEILLTIDGGTTAHLVADFNYGPAYWLDPNRHHFVYGEDVTTIVQRGDHTYTVSGEGLTFAENHGAGLLVVYEDIDLPYSQVRINDGLDSFYHGFPAPRGPDSETTYFDFDSSIEQRDADIVILAGGVEHDNRPNTIWYKTGTGVKNGFYKSLYRTVRYSNTISFGRL
jgi:hypothetical protein